MCCLPHARVGAKNPVVRFPGLLRWARGVVSLPQLWAVLPALLVAHLPDSIGTVQCNEIHSFT